MNIIRYYNRNRKVIWIGIFIILFVLFIINLLNTYYENEKLNHKPIEEQRKNLAKVVYPCKEFWKIASEYDIRVVYGIDTHHRGQIELFNEFVELANEIIGKDVIEKLNFVDLK